MNQNTFANCIYRQRRERGLTQEQLASRLGLTAQAISRWENGRTVPDFDSLVSLSKALEVSLDKLMGYSFSEQETTVYEKYYEQSGFFLGTRPDPLCLKIIELYPPERPTSVLLFGSGEGKDAVFLARNGYNVHAVELSDIGRHKAIQLAGVSGVPLTVQKANIADYQPEQQFDIIWINGPLSYLAPSLRDIVLTRFQNFTLPQGLNIAQVRVGKTYLPSTKNVDPNLKPWRSGELLLAYHNWEIVHFAEEACKSTLPKGDDTYLTNTLIARKKTLF